MIKIKKPDEVEKMRVAGAVVARTLAVLSQSIVPGKTTTRDLDALAESMLAEAGAVHRSKDTEAIRRRLVFRSTRSWCTAYPVRKRFRPGDIVGIDLGAIVNGYHGDGATTVAVGDISEEAKRLLRVTREALHKGIEQARPGRRIGDIGAAIQEHVERNGYSVVRNLVGHGIGRSMHEDPQVPNFGEWGRGVKIREGMTLAIEPMVNQGSYVIQTLDDHWTVVTKDKTLSAHFEHTVAVTSRGPDILTLEPGGGGVSING